MSASNRYVTPVETSILNRAINNALTAQLSGDPNVVWRCLKAIIFVTGNTELIQKMQPYIALVEREAAHVRNRRGYTVADQYNRRKAVERRLEQRNSEFFTDIMVALGERGYLENMRGVVTKVRDLKDMADKIRVGGS